MLFKRTQVPVDDEKEVDAVRVWFVEWTSRFGSCTFEEKKEAVAFLSPETAQEYKTALDNAFKLIRYTAKNEVTIRESTQIE